MCFWKVFCISNIIVNFSLNLEISMWQQNIQPCQLHFHCMLHWTQLAHVKNLSTQASHQHTNSTLPAAVDDNLMKPTWRWWGQPDPLFDESSASALAKSLKFYLCLQFQFLLYLHCQHLKLNLMCSLLLSSSFHLSLIWFSYFFLCHP